MKSLAEKLNEAKVDASVNENINANNITNNIADVIPLVEKALPELGKLIQKKLGFAPKLFVMQSGDTLRIESDDLSKELGKLGKALFKSIKIYTWGGNIMKNEENMIWINPKLSYEHPNGGSNGTDFLWDSLYFDFKNEKWLEGRSII